MKLIKILIPTFFIVFIFILLPRAVFASTLYLSPESANILVGETTTVKVMLDTAGEPINAVSAFLSYPEDKMEVTWVKDSNSAFVITADNTVNGGNIKISRGNFTGVKGKVNVATIGFKGKGLGNAQVTFVGGSAAPRATDSSDSLNLGSSKGGVYNITQGSKSRRPATLGEAVSWAGLQLSNLRDSWIWVIGILILVFLVMRKKRPGKKRA